MIQKIKDAIKRWSSEGMRWPFAHDSSTGKPSVTLLMFYVGFCLMVASALGLHIVAIVKIDAFDKFIMATMTTMLIWALGFIFYRLRHLDKIKVDLDDRSIELEGSDETSTDTNNSGQSGQNN